MTQALIQALQQHKSNIDHTPPEFRLYYDEDGSVLFYSMERLPGKYIVIDQQTYAEGRYDIAVINGHIQRSSQHVVRKLVIDSHGTPCHPKNVMVVDPLSGTFWKQKIYES